MRKENGRGGLSLVGNREVGDTMGCFGKQPDSICGAHPFASRGGDHVRWKCSRIRTANSDARIKPNSFRIYNR